MKKIIGIICALSVVFNVFAQDPSYDDLTGGLNTITTAVPFLLISPDSKAGAMGDVGVATTPDANSIHWNPAKLAFVEDDMGFSMSYVPWLRALVPDINLSYLAGYRKLNDNEAIGLELRYFSLGDITFTDILGTTIGQYKPSEFALGTSYSRKLSDNFSLAISGRYIYSNLTGGQSAGGIPTVAGQSIAADISGYYTKPIR
nr:PorV/PorQ family protein [Cryomorphaceae bacterium]